MCQTEDLLIRQQQEDRIEKYQKNLLKLTRKTKTNHCKKFFQENKLHLFKTWESILGIINTTKKVGVTLSSYKLTIEL